VELYCVSLHLVKVSDAALRLFLFHTALASGAPPAFPPLAVVEERGPASRRTLPDFATSRGFRVELAEGPAGVVDDPGAGFSPSFEGTVGVAPLAARNVLLTETGLKEANFFTAVDPERA